MTAGSETQNGGRFGPSAHVALFTLSKSEFTAAFTNVTAVSQTAFVGRERQSDLCELSAVTVPAFFLFCFWCLFQFRFLFLFRFPHVCSDEWEEEEDEEEEQLLCFETLGCKKT